MDKQAPADANTPSLLFVAATCRRCRPSWHSTYRARPVRFTCACTVLHLYETMAQELGLLHSSMPGFRTSGTRIAITHTLSYILSTFSPLLLPSRVFFCSLLTPILAPSTLTLEISYSSSDSSSGDSYSSCWSFQTTTRGISMHLRQSFSF